jgi:hypothetical protein
MEFEKMPKLVVSGKKAPDEFFPGKTVIFPHLKASQDCIDGTQVDGIFADYVKR